MTYRDLTQNELLNVSRHFNLLQSLTSVEFTLTEDNESDIVKTWLALIAGSVTSIGIDDQTLADLDVINSLTGEDVKAYIEALTLTEEVTTIPPEELNLESFSERKEKTLTFTTSPSKPISVKVMQRFGNSAKNLTEWHEVSSFVNVRYSQGREDGKPYTCTVPECTAVVRELKLVSPEQIGMSAN